MHSFDFDGGEGHPPTHPPTHTHPVSLSPTHPPTHLCDESNRSFERCGFSNLTKRDVDGSLHQSWTACCPSSGTCPSSQ